MQKITKTLVENLDPKPGKSHFVWDTAITGFGVKVTAKGHKSYVAKYRSHGGGRQAPQRWYKIGNCGAVSCVEARGVALQVMAAVARGEDPQAERLLDRTGKRLEDVWLRFQAEYLPTRKESTQKEYIRCWNRHLGPKWGKSRVKDIARSEVDQFHKGLRKTDMQANRLLAQLSRLMSLAECWEWRDQGTNPCRYIERFKERPRQRYLSRIELSRFGVALRDLTSSEKISLSASNAIVLLLLTGARLQEVLKMEWLWIDWEERLVFLPDSKTGQKQLFLSQEAIAVLKNQKTKNPHFDDRFVFPGRRPDRPMYDLNKPWKRLMEAAELKDFRRHDLRHTAGSLAARNGASLVEIGRLLGHTQAQTTLRYAHVAVDPALAVADKIGRSVSNAFEAGFGKLPGPEDTRH